MNEYKFSETEGFEALKLMEGFRPNAYPDTGGIPTIGYGSTYYEDGTPVKFGEFISEDRAASLFASIAARFEKVVKDSVKVQLTPNQFGALVCFVYNTGVGAFRSSTLLKKINAGDLAGAATEFPKWVYGRDKNGKKTVIHGLVHRREKEIVLFLKG